jgi:hypothetical protein
MRRHSLLRMVLTAIVAAGSILTLTLASVQASAPLDQASEMLRARAVDEGWVRVQVDLNKPDGLAIPADGDAAQVWAERLDQIADDFLFSLPVGSYRNVQRTAGSLALALTVSPAGLDAVLESADVAGVRRGDLSPKDATGGSIEALDPVPSDVCNARPTYVRVGTPAYASLTTSDCFSVERPGGHYCDNFLFDAIAGTTYTIELGSDDLDPYMYLLATQGGGVIAQDDDSGAGWNSRIVFTPRQNARFRVHATSFSRGDTGAYWLLITAGSSNTPPLAPSSLRARSLPRLSVELTWRDNSANERGFWIERRVGSGAWTRLVAAPPNGKRFVDSRLRPYTTYGYRVRAYNGFGYSDYSNEVYIYVWR